MASIAFGTGRCAVLSAAGEVAEVVLLDQVDALFELFGALRVAAHRFLERERHAVERIGVVAG